MIDGILARTCRDIQQTGLRPQEVEALLFALRESEPGGARARQLEQALMCGLHRILLNAARLVSKRTNVNMEDLLAEGQLYVLPRLRTFKPGKAEGLTLLPGYAAQIARQAMERYALAYRGAATVSRWASRKLFKSQRGLEDTSAIEAAVSPGAPLKDSEALVHTRTPEKEAEQHEAHVRLYTALSELPETQRRAIEQAYGLDDGPCDEAETDLSPEWEQMDLMAEYASRENNIRAAMRHLRERVQ